MATEKNQTINIKVIRPPRKIADLRPGVLGYIQTLAGGLMITGKHFFQKKDTMCYPEEKKDLPEFYRGFPKLIFNHDQQMENCVACKLCERVCPPRAITIIPGQHEVQTLRERRPATFVIDYGRCILCGYCEEACPCAAIALSKEYEHAAYTRADLIMTKDRLLVARDQLRLTP